VGLLEKFRSREKKELKEEIIEHIYDLLNTKKMFGTYQKDFGLDNYVYIGTNKLINKQIIQDIKECLKKFEKRITLEEVTSLPNQDPFILSFLIHCKVENASHVFLISFHHQKKTFH
jgi:predicted component of type VI protein secretion system